MIAKANKGKTYVIYDGDYTNKVHNFLDNKFQKLSKDPTDKYKKKHHQYTKTLQLDYPQKTDETPHPKETPTTLLKCTNQNTQTDKPIRPVVNKTNAPTYKVPKFLVNKLHNI
jgi:hypothetical protein